MSSAINQLQLLQQNLQNTQIQKQQLQNQLLEIDSALQSMHNTEKAYKILGHIMVSIPAEKLSQELQEKKEVFSLRLKNFITQEEKLKKNLEELQKEAVKELGTKNGWTVSRNYRAIGSIEGRI